MSNIKQPKVKKFGRKIKRKLGVEEPQRQSAYDKLLTNLKLGNRKTFLHRLIYVGEYSHLTNEEAVVNYFSDSISKANTQGVGIELITGFLLIYDIYYLHLVEADEDGIHAHLSLLFNNQPSDEFLLVSKVLVDLCHISDRMCEEWSYYSGIPKKLLNAIDVNCTIVDTAGYIFTCVGKIYLLIEAINSSKTAESTNGSHNTLERYIESFLQSSSKVLATESSKLLRVPSSVAQQLRSSITSKFSTSGIYESSGSLFFKKHSTPYKNLLPEAEILKFLVLSPITLDLYKYYNDFGNVPQRILYEDQVWPPQNSIHCAYDVFEKEYDRDVVMLKKTPQKKMLSGMNLHSIENLEEVEGDNIGKVIDLD